MIVVAESGSTKCDWIVMNHSGEILAEESTQGLNPYFYSEDDFNRVLESSEKVRTYFDQVSFVYFYGAGTSTQRLMQKAERALKRNFVNAVIKADHDLLGAAYATFDGSPGITCILGTGSNSCYFDGNTLYEELPSLAHLIGDEGSGGFFGKKLLRAYFYKRLPQNMHDAFVAEYNLVKDEFIQKAYAPQGANTWLASFMPFVNKFRNEEIVQEWLHTGFEEFLDIHVKCYSNWRDVPVHFVGSIAHYFEPELRAVCGRMGIYIGQIIQKPVLGLIKYHKDFLWPVN